MTMINRILMDSGATFIGGKKHRKYRLPNGRVFSMPSRHPSYNFRAAHNILSNLRRIMTEGMTNFPKPETTS